jgi:F-type H+-transporting ATPase subunit epsilon
MPMQVELVSPERILYSGEADMVIARTTEGDIAFLPGHAPFIGSLGIGPVSIHLAGGGVQNVAVHGGFVEVSGGRVTILSDVAELSDQIDVARAEAALARATGAPAEDEDAALARGRAQLRIDIARGTVGSKAGAGH